MSFRIEGGFRGKKDQEKVRDHSFSREIILKPGSFKGQERMK